MAADHVHRFGGSEFEYEEEAPRASRRVSPPTGGDTEDDPGLTAIRAKATADSPGGASGADGIEGADETGLIRVRIDDSGAVTDVVIPSNWQDEVGRHELGTALLTAANNAFANRMADELAGADLDRWPAPAAADEPADQAARAGDDGIDGISDGISDGIDDGIDDGVNGGLDDNEVLELLAHVERDLAAYQAQVRATAVNRTAQTRGVNGRIEVAMQPGHVSAVTIDRRWIQYARYTEIRAEAVSAFRSASRQAGSGRADSVPLPASLARIQELASDPRAMRWPSGRAGTNPATH